MRSLILAAALAATMVTPPTAASAAETASGSQGWRAAACSDQGTTEDATSGPSTLVASSIVPVDDLPGVHVGVDRLDFSGVTCEVLYVQGGLPRGASVRVVRNSWCARFDYALDGVPRDEGWSCASLAGPTRLYKDGGYPAPDDVHVMVVETFRAHESEVLTAEPGMPPELVGATMTADHTGSSWSVTLAGTTQVRRAFERSAVTDRKARAAHAVQVAHAERAYEQRVTEIEDASRSRGWKEWQIGRAAADRKEAVALAAKRLRLALDGFRLVSRELRSSLSGALPAA